MSALVKLRGQDVGETKRTERVQEGTKEINGLEVH